MLLGAVSSLLPPTNQCDTTSQNSENHNGTVAEPQVLRDYCFRAESQTAEDTKKYTSIKKYFSWPFSVWDLKFSVDNDDDSSCLWCDWHHTYIPLYIVLYSRTLEYWPSSMFFIPIFRSSFYSSFHIICLDLVSQNDMFQFKPRCF